MSDDEPFPLKYVIAICFGATIGIILIVFITICVVRSCRRIRSRQYRGNSVDLEQPLDQGAQGDVAVSKKNGSKGTGIWANGSSSRKSGMFQLTTIKESELIVSPSAPAQLDEEDMRAMYANGHAGNSAKLSEDVLRHTASPAKTNATKSLSVLKWLEGAELPQGSSGAAGSAGADSDTARVGCLPGASSGSMGSQNPLPKGAMTGGRFAASMRSLLSRLDTGELADMRRKLLISGIQAYPGDSSTQPLDVKGVVFARLPPSRLTSPAPSTIHDNMSVAGSTMSRTFRAHRRQATEDALPEAPEQQAQRALSMQRMSSQLRDSGISAASSAQPQAVQVGSAGGVAFATIGSLARTSLSRVSMTRGNSNTTTDSTHKPSPLQHTQTQQPPLPAYQQQQLMQPPRQESEGQVHLPVPPLHASAGGAPPPPLPVSRPAAATAAAPADVGIGGSRPSLVPPPAGEYGLTNPLYGMDIATPQSSYHKTPPATPQ